MATFTYSRNDPHAFELSNLATEISYGGTTVNYAFDACGNQVSEGTSRHMGWDYGDRMRTYATQVGTSEPTVYAHYLYDAGGNRVKKIVRKSAGNTEVTIYIDGGMEYLYELDGSTKVQEMNELHVMDGRSRIARVREVLLSSWTGAAPVGVLYNLEDHLGNASFSLTVTGGDYSREEYFPFGETSFRDFGKERYRFCGKERDEESGLYYYGARYYAPWGCRFVSLDPLAGEYPFYTPFQYAGNKPINFIDLDGLENNGNLGQDQSASKSPTGQVEMKTIPNDAFANLEVDGTSKAEMGMEKLRSKQLNLIIMVDSEYAPVVSPKEGDWSIISVRNLNELADPNSAANKQLAELGKSYSEIRNLAFIGHGRWSWASLNYGIDNNKIPEGMDQLPLNVSIYQDDVKKYLAEGSASTPEKTETLKVMALLGSKLSSDASIFFGACGSGRQCPGPGEAGNYLPEYMYQLLSQTSGSNHLTLYFPQDDFLWYGTL